MLSGLFSRRNINQGVAAWAATAGAVLLDVRTEEEYAAGHIDGSLNIPLHSMDAIENWVSDKNAAIFVYCQSGARSAGAAGLLKSKGYRRVTDIGGIRGYRGRTV
ncbi:MAG: rhodanese-like domain-containing protein [Coprobacillus sp.]|nr:MAG: rhodanese-like domain-containing protein [Coprobacillus sp.]